MGTYTLVAADYGKSAHRLALINKIEVKTVAEDASQWQDLGRIKAGKLTFEPIAPESAGKIPNQLAWRVTFECAGLASSTNLLDALADIVDNASSVRLTNFDAKTFAFDSATEMDWIVGSTIEGDAEDAVLVQLSGSGTISDTRFKALWV